VFLFHGCFSVDFGCLPVARGPLPWPPFHTQLPLFWVGLGWLGGFGLVGWMGRGLGGLRAFAFLFPVTLLVLVVICLFFLRITCYGWRWLVWGGCLGAWVGGWVGSRVGFAS
jgi:hypothetical protein